MEVGEAKGVCLSALLLCQLRSRQNKGDFFTQFASFLLSIRRC
jgi:hypothetical protein